MIAGITCFFNFCQYKRPVQNLRRFLRNCEKDGIEIFGVELVLQGHDSVMDGNKNWKVIYCGERGIMFQKECLLKLAERLVPKGYNKIVMLDSDILFGDKDWVSSTSKALDEHLAVQPFETCVWTSRDGREFMRRKCCARVGLDSTWEGHPGFAWAVRRDFFTEVCLYDYAILGHGDSILTCGLTKVNPFGHMLEGGVGMEQKRNGILDRWLSDCADWNHGEVGWVPGVIWHEYHGAYKNRKYATRSGVIADLDVMRDLVSTKDGLYLWSDNSPPEMRLGVLEYLEGRKEDE